MKKVLCAILALALLAVPAMALSATAATAEAANPESDFLYDILKGEAYVEAYVGTAGRVVIPDTLGGAPVKVIYNFGAPKHVTSVVLPDTVREIGQYAFTNCSSLAEINLPEGLRSIGISAFSGCEALRSVRIPSTTSEIGFSAFGIWELTELTVAEGNPYLYSEGNCIIERSTKTLVHGCSTSVIPDGVKTIRCCAFSGVGLKEAVIPDSVRTIEESAFWAAMELEKVTLGSGVQTIGEEAFFGCHELSEIHIPASVQTVGKKAFDFCIKMTDIYCDAPFRTGGWDANWLGDCTARVHWNEDAAVMGDLNASGAIDSLDYMLLKRHCLNTFKLTEGQETVADVNGDNIINAADYMLVKRHVLGTFKIG